ncbi:hypothetical protein Tco_0539472, partial [Tanacetum coccineum]
RLARSSLESYYEVCYNIIRKEDNENGVQLEEEMCPVSQERLSKQSEHGFIQMTEWRMNLHGKSRSKWVILEASMIVKGSYNTKVRSESDLEMGRRKEMYGVKIKWSIKSYNPLGNPTAASTLVAKSVNRSKPKRAGVAVQPTCCFGIEDSIFMVRKLELDKKIAIEDLRMFLRMLVLKICILNPKICSAEEATSGSLSQSFLGGFPHTIKAIHFDQALRKVSPSVLKKV